jgi:hypothetical protein
MGVLQRLGAEDEEAVVAGVDRVQHPVQVVLGRHPVADVAHGGHDERRCTDPEADSG